MLYCIRRVIRGLHLCRSQRQPGTIGLPKHWPKIPPESRRQRASAQQPVCRIRRGDQLPLHQEIIRSSCLPKDSHFRSAAYSETVSAADARKCACTSGSGPARRGLWAVTAVGVSALAGRPPLVEHRQHRYRGHLSGTGWPGLWLQVCLVSLICRLKASLKSDLKVARQNSVFHCKKIGAKQVLPGCCSSLPATPKAVQVTDCLLPAGVR